MSSDLLRKHDSPRDLLAWAVHLTLYSVLLVIYSRLVLVYLGSWLLRLFLNHRWEYALIAILVMIVQAVALDAMSALILRLVRGKNFKS